MSSTKMAIKKLTRSEMLDQLDQLDIEDNYLHGYLATLGLDTTTVHELFELLDDKNTGIIDIKGFVQGCMRIRGEARSMDLYGLMVESRNRHTMHAAFMDSVERRFDNIEELILKSRKSSLHSETSERTDCGNMRARLQSESCPSVTTVQESVKMRI